MSTTSRYLVPLAFVALLTVLAAPGAHAQQAAPAEADPHVAAPVASGDPHAAEPAPTSGSDTAPVHASPTEPGSATPASPHAAPDAHGTTSEHAEGGHEGESIWSILGRLFNFAVLAGGLYYFLKAPIANYLSSRSEQIRSDLVNAKATREAATRELADIEARMKSLPAEIEGLKARGRDEIAAEQARISGAAEAERERLLEQARVEIAQQTRAARRELREYAATLAVDVARARLSTEMTDADRARLVERYVEQVKTVHD